MSDRTRRLLIPLLLCVSLLSVSAAAQVSPKNDAASVDDLRCVEKNYRHKTDAELKRMSPEQLADESTNEWIYHASLMDQYGMFTINSYTEKIGVEIVPVLTDVAKKFASRPRSDCLQERFFTVFAIASDVDEQVVRLRSSADGRDAISAAVAAVKAMLDAGLADDRAHPYNKSHFGLYLLESVRGINEEDQAIRELLGSEYRVQFSNQSFAEFVEFLIANYPTYPSWTPRVNQARDLRPDKKKYHDAYLKFNKVASTH
jgi:hypothetical protein